jgi:hypothetical protein
LREMPSDASARNDPSFRNVSIAQFLVVSNKNCCVRRSAVQIHSTRRERWMRRIAGVSDAGAMDGLRSRARWISIENGWFRLKSWPLVASSGQIVNAMSVFTTYDTPRGIRKYPLFAWRSGAREDVEIKYGLTGRRRRRCFAHLSSTSSRAQSPSCNQ